MEEHLAPVVAMLSGVVTGIAVGSIFAPLSRAILISLLQNFTPYKRKRELHLSVDGKEFIITLSDLDKPQTDSIEVAIKAVRRSNQLATAA